MATALYTVIINLSFVLLMLLFFPFLQFISVFKIEILKPVNGTYKHVALYWLYTSIQLISNIEYSSNYQRSQSFRFWFRCWQRTSVQESMVFFNELRNERLLQRTSHRSTVFSWIRSFIGSSIRAHIDGYHHTNMALTTHKLYTTYNPIPAINKKYFFELSHSPDPHITLNVINSRAHAIKQKVVILILTSKWKMNWVRI